MKHIDDCPWDGGFKRIVQHGTFGETLEVTEKTLIYISDGEVLIQKFEFCPMCGAYR